MSTFSATTRKQWLQGLAIVAGRDFDLCSRAMWARSAPLNPRLLARHITWMSQSEVDVDEAELVKQFDDWIAGKDNYLQTLLLSLAST